MLSHGFLSVFLDLLTLLLWFLVVTILLISVTMRVEVRNVHMDTVLLFFGTVFGDVGLALAPVDLVSDSGVSFVWDGISLFRRHIVHVHTI